MTLFLKAHAGVRSTSFSWSTGTTRISSVVCPSASTMLTFARGGYEMVSIAMTLTGLTSPEPRVNSSRSPTSIPPAASPGATIYVLGARAPATPFSHAATSCNVASTEAAILSFLVAASEQANDSGAASWTTAAATAPSQRNAWKGTAACLPPTARKLRRYR